MGSQKRARPRLAGASEGWSCPGVPGGENGAHGGAPPALRSQGTGFVQHLLSVHTFQRLCQGTSQTGSLEGLGCVQGNRMAEAVTESIAERDLCFPRIEEMERPRARGQRDGAPGVGTRAARTGRGARRHRGPHRSRPPRGSGSGSGGMPLPAGRQHRRQRWGRVTRLRRHQVLTLLEDYPFPEVLYVELWMVPMLLGESPGPHALGGPGSRIFSLPSLVPVSLPRPGGPKADRIREVLRRFNPDEYGLKVQSHALHHRRDLAPVRGGVPDYEHGYAALDPPKSR